MKPRIPSADWIRNLYPNPMSLSSATAFCTSKKKYCVGGAFINAMQLGDDKAPSTYFPSAEILGKKLERANPALDPMAALSYAANIIAYNDNEQFEKAWETLDQALQYEENQHD